VGDVGELQDAVDEGEAKGAQGKDAADYEAIHKELRCGKGRPNYEGCNKKDESVTAKPVQERTCAVTDQRSQFSATNGNARHD